jgi:autotransporter-associated beta strand protein
MGSGITTAFSAVNLLGTSAKLQIDTGGTLQLADVNSLTAYKTVTYSQTVGSLNGSGTVTSGATAATQGTLTVDSSVTNLDSTFSGTITNAGTAMLGLAKEGSKTLTLSGTNSYTGTTAVNAGTLLINGSHSGTGAISVANGATFGRTGSTGGSLGGNVSFLDGSIIKLSLGAALANSSLDRTGGTWAFDTNQAFTFDLTGAVVGNYTGLITGLLGTEAGLGTINTWTNTNGVSGTFSYNSGSNSVDFNMTAIPEPSTWALLAFSLCTVIFLRRRRA